MRPVSKEYSITVNTLPGPSEKILSRNKTAAAIKSKKPRLKAQKIPPSIIKYLFLPASLISSHCFTKEIL